MAVLRRARWCEGIPGGTAEIDCGRHRHRITWRHGKLVLEDHDLLAERSLAALGSEPPMCVQVLDAWRRARGADYLYEFLRRGLRMPSAEFAFWKRYREEALAAPTPSIGSLPPRAPGSVRRAIQRTTERQLAEQREHAQRMWELALVDALPLSIRRALALSVIVTIERRWHDDEYRWARRERLEAALNPITAPLLERSARHWRRDLRPFARFVTEARLLGRWEQPTCTASIGTAGASATLSLPLSWLIDVWARGIALVDGCFVLGRTDEAHDATVLPVVAVRWERAAVGNSCAVETPALVTRDSSGDWSLRWV